MNDYMQSTGVIDTYAVSPIVTNSLFPFRTHKSDYHCRRCQAQDTDQSVVVSTCPARSATSRGRPYRACWRSRSARKPG